MLKMFIANYSVIYVSTNILWYSVFLFNNNGETLVYVLVAGQTCKLIPYSVDRATAVKLMEKSKYTPSTKHYICLKNVCNRSFVC